MELILASQSPARAQLLRDAGLAFRAIPARIDESALIAALVAGGHGGRDVADALAEAKALKLAAQHPGALVVGGDQLLALDDGSLLEAPPTPDAACAQLAVLAGRRHRLFSAVAVAETVGDGAAGVVWRHVAVAAITLRPLSDSQIADYVAAQWPQIAGCVGCYQVEGAGVQLFERVEGDRWTIMGLPMLPLLAWLRTRGLAT